MSTVISDIFGVTGTKLIDALLQDNYNFDELIELCHGRIKAKQSELKEALVGKFTSHHKFMLRTIRMNMDHIKQLIKELDAYINDQTKHYTLEIELLQTIPGINKLTSIGLLAEIGADMNKFSTEQHLASWAGMCPGNNESAGKKK